VELHLAQNPEADELLSRNPLALLIGMVLDQQVPLEWAFSGPLELEKRLGGPLEAGAIAAVEPDTMVELFSRRPALHRYPGAMAKRVHELCRVVAEEYGDRAEHIWEDVATAAELRTRIRKLPGFGDHKSRIFVALLGKQLGVRPDGWVEESTPFGDKGSLRSVADIVDQQSLDKVRAWKQAAKAKVTAKATAKATAKVTASTAR
jgi:uncharacterized HhH-GPD family protein